MRRIMIANADKIEILKWHESSSVAAQNEFCDRSSILSFFRQFMFSHTAMRSLRNLLSDESRCQDISRMSDHDVLDQLARRLASEHVRIAVLPAETLVMSSHVLPKDREISPEPFGVVEPEVAPKEESVPPAMFAQAAAFRRAARSGAPLCSI